MRPLFVICLLAFCGNAFATKPTPPNYFDPSADADASAEAVVNTDPSARAAAGAIAGAEGGAAYGYGGANELGDISPSQSLNDNSRFRAISVGFSSAAAAAAADGCHESWGGKDGTLVKTGGRDVINEPCLAFEQCMRRAEFYHAIGRTDLAIVQLGAEDCGGLQDPPAAAEALIPVADCQERQRRLEEFALSECGKSDD